MHEQRGDCSFPTAIRQCCSGQTFNRGRSFNHTYSSPNIPSTTTVFPSQPHHFTVLAIVRAPLVHLHLPVSPLPVTPNPTSLPLLVISTLLATDRLHPECSIPSRFSSSPIPHSLLARVTSRRSSASKNSSKITNTRSFARYQSQMHLPNYTKAPFRPWSLLIQNRPPATYVRSLTRHSLAWATRYRHHLFFLATAIVLMLHLLFKELH